MASFFGEYTDLDRLGVRHNTNKSSRWKNASGEIIKKHSLLDRYEFFLRQKKNLSPLSLLELGAGPNENIGASLRCWKDYFTDKDDIHVADIKETATVLKEEGFHVHIGDLGSIDFLRKLAQKKWDFILDDASHLWAHQILAFRHLFPALKNGGIYIVEDLCTSFGQYRKNYGSGSDEHDAASYFLALSRFTCGGALSEHCAYTRKEYDMSAPDCSMAKVIDMIAWIGNACIIIKK